MRTIGISYSTGCFSAGGIREPFDPDRVEREMQIIHDDLHCNAVRIIGGDPERLEIAGTHAAAAGLEVWICPFTLDRTTDELLALFADCAERAERLRQRGAAVVFVAGAELTLLAKGFLPGDTFAERLALLTEPQRLRAVLPQLPARFNAFLGQAVGLVRERFGGRVTYAAVPYERIDWTPFDFIGVDAYKSSEVADRYAGDIQTLVAQGKPVAITEFGCTTQRGAADLGARNLGIVDRDSAGVAHLKGEYVRDEAEQAAYLRESLDIFTTAGVDSAFWTIFTDDSLPHREDPREDLDLASFGVVKVLEGRHGATYPNLPWEPKAAFTALAAYNADRADSGKGRES
jgi:hypothetical protein